LGIPSESALLRFGISHRYNMPKLKEARLVSQQAELDNKVSPEAIKEKFAGPEDDKALPPGPDQSIH